MFKISSNSKYAKSAGFTLVELLIVVIILAVLAAVVVPQFSSSTDDAKISALDTSLANMRAVIDLYYQQHNGKYPGENDADGGACATGKGTGKKETETGIMDQLTRYTDVSGNSCGVKDTTYKYGPYIKKDTLPQNPLTEVATLNISTAGALGMTSSVTNGGWKYDLKSGQFIADHQDYDDH